MSQSGRILMHGSTAHQVQLYLQRPSHGLLMKGDKGTGVDEIVRHVSAQLLGVNTNDLFESASFLEVDPDKFQKQADMTREIVRSLSLIVPGDKDIRRVIVIKNAHKLNHVAQNVLLKSLEEPPRHSVIILTTHNPEALLATVKSRLQRLKVNPLTKSEAVSGLIDDYDEPNIIMAWQRSGGRAERMRQLLELSHDQELDTYTVARNLLGKNLFDQLSEVDILTKNEDLSEIIAEISTISSAALTAATTDHDRLRWATLLRASHTAFNQLSASGNKKLVLTNLFLTMRP